MKFLAILGNFISALLLSLFLTIVAVNLIPPPESESITDLVAIAQEDGWFHQRNSARRMWDEYENRKRDAEFIETKKFNVRGLIAFGILFPACWWGMRWRRQIWQRLSVVWKPVTS